MHKPELLQVLAGVAESLGGMEARGAEKARPREAESKIKEI